MLHPTATVDTIAQAARDLLAQVRTVSTNPDGPCAIDTAGRRYLHAEEFVSGGPDTPDPFHTLRADTAVYAVAPTRDMADHALMVLADRAGASPADVWDAARVVIRMGRGLAPHQWPAAA